MDVSAISEPNSVYLLETFLQKIFGDKEEKILLMFSLGHLAPFTIFFLVGFWKFGGAPYGRYKPKDPSFQFYFGPVINDRIAWFIQGLPAFCWPLFLLFFSEGKQLTNKANIILLWLWIIHYFHR